MASDPNIEIRTARTEDSSEYRAYLRLFWDIPLGIDPTFTRRSDEFIESWMQSARTNETELDTFSGIALHRDVIVGVHILRIFEEYERMGAHIAGLWVHPEHRGKGIARRLKEAGEAWARGVGASFLNTNVQIGNDRMRRINENAGFEEYRLNMRKELR